MAYSAAVATRVCFAADLGVWSFVVSEAVAAAVSYFEANPVVVVAVADGAEAPWISGPSCL